MTASTHRYADAALDRLWDGFTYLVMNGGREPLRTRIVRHLPGGLVLVAHRQPTGAAR